MYRGRQSQHEKNLAQTRLTNLNKTVQNQDDTLQKQIEYYTRKFEQEKRKLFRAQQNHREILKDYQNEVADLQKLKSTKYQTQVTTLSSKLKFLQVNLQKGICAYNQALSKNNLLKSEIDQLRKDKKNQREGYKALVQKIEEINSSISSMDQNIETKKNKVDVAKRQIVKVRQKNQKQNNQHISNIEQLKKSVCFNSTVRQTKNSSNKQTTEASDTQPIVKLRIRNLMHVNKQRIRISELYKKNMQKIWQSFQQIKEQSGVYDLQEITKTFLKQQQQNTIIFQYINKLTTQLELIRQQNSNLASKIKTQQQIIKQHRALMNGTPQEKMQKIKIDNFYKQKQKHIQDLNAFLQQIQPGLLKILKIENKQNQKLLSYSNIQTYLASLQDMINQNFQISKSENNIDNEDFSKSSKPAPNIIMEQLKQKNQQSLLEQMKLRQYASEFWEKKRANK